jgi:hypothetical protein
LQVVSILAVHPVPVVPWYVHVSNGAARVPCAWSGDEATASLYPLSVEAFIPKAPEADAVALVAAWVTRA